HEQATKNRRRKQGPRFRSNGGRGVFGASQLRRRGAGGKADFRAGVREAEEGRRDQPLAAQASTGGWSWQQRIPGAAKPPLSGRTSFAPWRAVVHASVAPISGSTSRFPPTRQQPS